MKLSQEELNEVDRIFEAKKQNFLKHIQAADVEDINDVDMQLYGNVDEDLNDDLGTLFGG